MKVVIRNDENGQGREYYISIVAGQEVLLDRALADYYGNPEQMMDKEIKAAEECFEHVNGSRKCSED